MPIDKRLLYEQEQKQTNTKNVPFRGGANTYLEPEQLPFGGYSDAQNVRNTHPGIIKRPGQQRLNSTAEGSVIATMFQFSKGKKTERHFYAQCGTNILEANTVPPGSITGSFGSIVFTQSASPKPAAWTVITDKMLFSNGVDGHQIYTGLGTPVEKFMVYKAAAAHKEIPDAGSDYSLEVLDDSTTTVATIDGLGTLADDYDAIYIMTPVPAKAFNVVMGNKNSTGASLSMNYWNGSWTSITSIANGTSAAASCALGADGSIAWSPPTDEITKNIYGANGFWYQLYLVGGSLSGVCDIATMTYDASFQPLQNVWDGIPINLVEAQVFTSNIAGAASFYQTQSPDAVVISSLLPTQKVYLATTDPLEAIYVDMGALTNSHIASIDTVGIFCGSTWSVASNVYDYTSGFVKSGWITFKRHPSVQPVQFGQLLNYAYWYYLQMSGSTTSSNLVVGFTGQPFFSIGELGDGLVNTGWKNRACYVFENTPNFIHVSEAYQPTHLNGSDSAILKAGDGRSNKVVCVKNFYNEMMAWQEEKGVDGGTLTLFEGYSPDTFGTLVLSNKVGTFSPKSAVVVDGVLTSTATDEQIKTMAYFLSHYGIFGTDGRVVYGISDDIADYFNITKSTCIRYGYEDKMWIGYDSTYNVLRVGLVSGASASECNVFPVYDLVDKTWTFDKLGQALNSYIEAEAGSGNTPLVQVGGGTDGYAYKLNNSQNDVSTAIDAYVRMELNLSGNEFMVKDIKLRHKTQTAGNISIIPYQNGVEKPSFTVPMTAERSNETIRRMKKTVDILGTNVAFKIGNASLSNDMTLFDIGFNLEVFDDR
jgi:hypothetical protein